MEYCKFIINDIFRCLKSSSIISLSIGILVGIISFITNKGSLIESAYAIRSTLLIIGSLIIVLGAILILKKRTENQLENIEEWKEKYKKFSYKTVMILNGFIIVLYGGIIDWILYI